MNSGYLSYILFTLVSILLWSGWRTHLIGDGSARAAFCFVAAWIAASALQWSNGSTLISLVYVPLLLLAGILLKQVDNPARRSSAVSFSLLVGALCSLIMFIEAVDPLFIVFHPMVDPIALTSLLIIVYARDARMQLLIVSLSLLINDVYLALLYREWTEMIFGGRYFQDRWWLTAAAVRIGSEAGVSAGMFINGIYRLFGFVRFRK